MLSIMQFFLHLQHFIDAQPIQDGNLCCDNKSLIEVIALPQILICTTEHDQDLFALTPLSTHLTSSPEATKVLNSKQDTIQII